VLACLRIARHLTVVPAQGSLPACWLGFGRAGFAPAGRRTGFRDATARSLLPDQPCLVAPWPWPWPVPWPCPVSVPRSRIGSRGTDHAHGYGHGHGHGHGHGGAALSY